jgi:hypothetical protein
VYLFAKFGALMPLKSAVRITLCAAIVYGASLIFVTASRVLIVIQLAAGVVLYFILLVLTGELGRDDLVAVKKVVKA